jgi:hypothetical protein
MRHISVCAGVKEADGKTLEVLEGAFLKFQRSWSLASTDLTSRSACVRIRIFPFLTPYRILFFQN